MTPEKYNNTKCEYKLMAKCRLCGEVFDAFQGDNTLIFTPKDAVFHLTYPSYQMNDMKYVHHHDDNSYGLADPAGLVYMGEWKE